MTERKPIGMSFESWVEQQIGDAVDRGDFDGLPGVGKALPPTGDDEDWWFRDYLRRQEVTADVSLPLPLRLRKEADEIDDAVRALTAEDRVRAVVDDLNQRVEQSWRLPADGALIARRLDAEAVVARWQASRPGSEPVEAEPSADARHTTPSQRSAWWNRFTQRRHAAG